MKKIATDFTFIQRGRDKAYLRKRVFDVYLLAGYGDKFGSLSGSIVVSKGFSVDVWPYDRSNQVFTMWSWTAIENRGGRILFASIRPRLPRDIETVTPTLKPDFLTDSTKALLRLNFCLELIKFPRIAGGLLWQHFCEYLTYQSPTDTNKISKRSGVKMPISRLRSIHLMDLRSVLLKPLYGNAYRCFKTYRIFAMSPKCYKLLQLTGTGIGRSYLKLGLVLYL